MTQVDTRWQFWIDVGGTFTDCLAYHPDGSLKRHKLLSSGITPGQIDPTSTNSTLIDPQRQADPENFWTGYRVRLFNQDQKVLAERTVQSFSRADGALELSEPLDEAPLSGSRYEFIPEEEAPILGIRYLLGLKKEESIPACSVRLGTTRGTNALITRGGAKTAFITTMGFGDILHIGYQNRPDLFAIDIEKPKPLPTKFMEIEHRLDSEGEELEEIDPQSVKLQLLQAKEQGIESLAICLLHGYRAPEVEEQIAEIARGIGFEEISLSSKVSPLIRLVARGDTTVVDAYLNPVLRRYMQSLHDSLGESELRIMTSAGGLVRAEEFVGKDSILSGPAGGVVGFSRVAQTAGFDKAIGFDMGGTSTDVSRFDGEFELEYENQKAGVRVVAPMLAIETVAAGGGSLCGFDGVKLTVGPASAGAHPGPACYGNGGPLAVTDLNFFLGKILPEHFPIPLDADAVETRLQQIQSRLKSSKSAQVRHDYSLAELADGFLRIANAKMVEAIRSISVAKGYDPREYVLVGFGGAAAQHACAVARELGMRQILNHPDAGILSAYGIGQADITRHAEQGIYQAFESVEKAELTEVFDELTEPLREALLEEGIAEDHIEIRHALELRYHGLESTLIIDEPEDGDYGRAYAEVYEQRYGFRPENRPIEIVAARVSAKGSVQDFTPQAEEPVSRELQPEKTVQTYFEAEPHETAVFDRSKLRPGDTIQGPAILFEKVSTTVIDPGWEAEVLPRGELLLTDHAGHPAAADAGEELKKLTEEQEHETNTSEIARLCAEQIPADPVRLEIFNQQFAGIAEQMGLTLRNTASSVNIKERLDFSCALFTSRGELVVNAPHIPVHLGSMGLAVRAILEDHAEMQPGDVFVTNNPYRGGSHLPDVTVITPVHDPETKRLLFLVASRAHHAELGGIEPGSMPPFSCNLAEEGVLIDGFLLVEQGKDRLEALAELLRNAQYPSRDVDSNLADVQAQLAANQQGVRDLQRMFARWGLPTVFAYMHHIQVAAEQKMRNALRELSDGQYTFHDYLDNGSKLAVKVTVQGEEATLDFTGTGPTLEENLNANRAIVTAAVLYCMRLLINEDIPLNEGVLQPIKIILPDCLLNPQPGATPLESPAVVGGNVETSQRVVDVVLGALQLVAASQGTMNNFTFGNDDFGYYETIGGGAGASERQAGASGVHTHMTNTRLTDPEVLELRYPVRLWEFSIRRDSGGRGLKQGGNGLVRRIEFLEPLEVSLLTQRRGDYPPYGLNGGEAGAIGRNFLICADEREELLPGCTRFSAQPGDILILETPGGGGYGKPDPEPHKAKTHAAVRGKTKTGHSKSREKKKKRDKLKSKPKIRNLRN
ncbi:Hydantoinase B/oxoprolinase [Planctomycetales bacterium 10988]|nr:Hydantoinase B/oxoprolinase [Planctomycetales bacterium 10988]